jgi:hypothetical protein
LGLTETICLSNGLEQIRYPLTHQGQGQHQGHGAVDRIALFETMLQLERCALTMKRRGTVSEKGKQQQKKGGGEEGGGVEVESSPPPKNWPQIVEGLMELGERYAQALLAAATATVLGGGGGADAGPKSPPPKFFGFVCFV